MTKYFVNCKNLDELKKTYKAAAEKFGVTYKNIREV